MIEIGSNLKDVLEWSLYTAGFIAFIWLMSK